MAAPSENVRVERNAPVTTVIIDRPQARNAVDRPTADALVHAFLEFEHDKNALACVLWGEGGTFCAGADLKGMSEGRGNRLIAPGTTFDPHGGDAPMGPTRMRLSTTPVAARRPLPMLSLAGDRGAQTEPMNGRYEKLTRFKACGASPRYSWWSITRFCS